MKRRVHRCTRKSDGASRPNRDATERRTKDLSSKLFGSTMVCHVLCACSKSIFWPSQRAAYYLGLLPRLVLPPHTASIMHSRLAHQAHTICIQLASRIWGLVRRTARDHATCQRRQRLEQRVLPLPSQLSTLFHTLVYPSFSITFS